MKNIQVGDRVLFNYKGTMVLCSVKLLIGSGVILDFIEPPAIDGYRGCAVDKNSDKINEIKQKKVEVE